MGKGRETDRQDAETLAGDASILFHNGRYAGALELFDRAIALDDDNVRALGGRSLVLVQLGQPREGLQAAEEALRRDPSYAPSHTAVAFCYHRLGREKEAEEAFGKALALDPNEPRVLYNYACYWAELREEGQCRKYLARAFPVVAEHTLEHAPNDPDLALYVHTDWFRELLAQAKQTRRTSAPGASNDKGPGAEA